MTEIEDVTPGVYEHFKGGRYEVLALARHSESLEWHVFYRTLYGDRSLWIRPLSMFTESVTHEGVRRPRFRRAADQGLHA
ncbi:DUF1653 domain-containing protein [Leifsonia sp. 22587]|uniref:DUF1653 domain-containing protein n=1 Tax=Leifsonia sp. 22587 TaxID=3453946 RepID=UPI003F864895